MKNYALTPAEQRKKLETAIDRLDSFVATVSRLGGMPNAIEIFEAEVTENGQRINAPTPLMPKIMAETLAAEINENRNIICEVLNSIVDPNLTDYK